MLKCDRKVMDLMKRFVSVSMRIGTVGTVGCSIIEMQTSQCKVENVDVERNTR